MTQFKDLTGKTFGRWFVESLFSRGGQYVKWNCICECGTKKVIAGASLRSGLSTSCGCLKNELTAKRQLTHGFTGTKVYQLWRNIKARCSNPKNPHYHNYGGRGIKMYDDWKDAKIFCEWALTNGWKENLDMDRIDNNGNYEPNNCHFVSRLENLYNTRRNIYHEYNGAIYNTQELEVITGIPKKKIRRISYNDRQRKRICLIKEPVKGVQSQLNF